MLHRFKDQTVVVTGGGGFLGKALSKALISEGALVRTIQRSFYPILDELGVKQFQLDLSTTSVNELAKVINGADIVFHTAAKVSMWGIEADFIASNINGTKNLIEACIVSKCNRFVFTSSPSVIANGSDLRDVDESIPYPNFYHSLYPKTKAKAEQIVLAANSDKFFTLSLRPHLIYGPGDTSLEELVVKKAKAGRLVQIGAGENLADFTYIDDCVEAHLCAAESLLNNPNCRGRAYFISQGQPIKLWEWIEAALRRNNLPAIKRKIPARLAIFLGSFFETICKLSPIDIDPPFTRFLAEEMSTDHYFDISAARRELGFNPQKRDLLTW